jgi:RHS repeat-associated protein
MSARQPHRMIRDGARTLGGYRRLRRMAVILVACIAGVCSSLPIAGAQCDVPVATGGCGVISQYVARTLDDCEPQAQAAATAFIAGCGSSACCDVGGLGVSLNMTCFCAAAPGPGPGHGPTCGDPVDMATGIFTYDHADVTVNDVMPLKLTRSYREFDTLSRAFGVGMSDNYDMFIVGDGTGYWSSAALVLPNATQIPFQRTTPGNALETAAFTSTSTPGPYFGSTLSFSDAAGWTLVLRDGTQMIFGAGSILQSITDRNGNQIQIQRTNSSTTITSPNGRWINLYYDSNGRAYEAQDNSGRTTWYVYNAGGYLSKFYDANGGLTSYAYDSSNRMISYTTPNGNVHGKNQYDTNSRVIVQTQPDGGQYNFSYLLDGNNNVTEADMTDPIGSSCNLTFDSNGYQLSDTWAVGRPEQQATTYNRATNTELLNSFTDPLGRTTGFTYDARGNTTSVTRLSGTSQAVTTSATYDPTFSQLTSVTDPLGHTWSVGLDGHGNATAVTDPLGDQITATYNGAGQPTSIANAAGNTLQLAYSAGLLTSITDPLGNDTTVVYDGIGRTSSVSDPLGHLTSFSYDLQDDLVALVDANGVSTTFSYDGDRNLLTLTDGNGNTTSYSYDGMDRSITRTDALGHADHYTFDGNSNLISHTDRRGQMSSYQYDGLNRRTLAGFGQNGSNYQSSIVYTWDAGNRLTQILDSIAGTITRTYDGLDRLTQEVTPQGSVNYSYDNGSRRAALQVMGQPQVSYVWDNANRLTGITQSSQSVGLSYDAANRRTQLTLPNGVAVAYAYDADSRVSGINYGNNDGPLGNLAYSYDADGRVISETGTMAPSLLPAAVAGNSFNADNAMTGFGGQPLTYDANGNLTNDGTNTYAWDARNHLTGISGVTSAAFIYDGVGRRSGKNMNGAATQFLYDGLNPVQELDGSSPPNVTANLLMGLRIDEYFSRADSNGPMSFLSDALGSTLAVTDPMGGINTSYSYDPFGNTAVNGPSSNPYQFTGRENDATGLYYYRARYYSPAYQRFIGQDPIGFASGQSNLYGYVAQRPTQLRDPTGLCHDGKKPCLGTARVLEGNPDTIGEQGGFPGVPVQDGTGAIAPEQFGYQSGGQMGGWLASQISGDLTLPDGSTVSFNGITDVIGGYLGVRQDLMDDYPGDFLLELPDGSDLGQVPITLWVPWFLPCPAGTFSPLFE